MADIFVEVDEAMKREKMEQLWQRYGGFFIGFLAVIILGTAANAGYKSWEHKKNSAQTSSFLNVIDKESYGAEDLLAIAPDLGNGLRAIAQVQAAGIGVTNNNNAVALETYQKLANNKNTDAVISKLAVYMIINLSKDITAKEKISKLNAVISDKQNPWRFHAMLDCALIEASENNDFGAARAHLSSILSSEMTPKTMKQKAQSLDIIYAINEKR